MTRGVHPRLRVSADGAPITYISIVTPGRWDLLPMLRQDFAIVLTQVVDLAPYGPATATFIDVPSDNYAYSYVEAVYRAGLMSGVGDSKFDPRSVISPQDMTALFKRALG